MRFLKHISLHLLLKKITDRRDLKKTRYHLEVLLHWALFVFFFRTESLNELQQAFNRLLPCRKKALWNFFGMPEGSPFPHRQTVTDALVQVSRKEIKALLAQLFKWALKYKIFYNHQNVLGIVFVLASDGFVVHHYNHPHSSHEKEVNACPYCLPRTRNKNAPQEKTHWIHTFVNFAVIFPGGVQLPL